METYDTNYYKIYSLVKYNDWRYRNTDIGARVNKTLLSVYHHGLLVYLYTIICSCG